MSDYLPEEVVIKILTKLPPKTLIRFKCVSKSWNSLISSPYFVSLHTETLLSSSHETNRIVIRRYSKSQNTEVYTVHPDDEDFGDDKSIRLEYPFRDDTRFYYRIVGSCNGVLCLVDDLFGYADSVLLWNPVIKRKLVLLPKTTSDSIFVVGFGFDLRNNEFKVVRMTYVQEDYGYVMPPKAEVFALSKGNWHAVEGEIPKNCVVEYFWSQVFVNGNVHWVAYKHDKVENLIMLFNLSLEVFDEIELPDELKNVLPINLNAVDLQGSIGVVQYDERVWSKSCCIWVMQKYRVTGSWCKLHNVDIEGGIGTILGLRTNGDVLLTVRNRGLVSYDSATGKCADLGVFGTKDSIYVGTYFESLALLVEGKEARERVPSDSDCDNDSGSGSDSEYESSGEDDEDRFRDVEKSEFWMQCSMAQYLTALLRRRSTV